MLFCLRSLACTAAVAGLAAISVSCAADDKTATTSLAQTADEAALPKGVWTPIFNGKDLTGWTPKIRGCNAGENYLDTFRVVDGNLVVSYDKYEKFDNRFGHLFYKGSYGNYRLRAEYRFIGEQVKQGPGWANRNNGFMILGQPVETMLKEQEFPVSIEVQLLGGFGKGERSTSAICTPGTNIYKNGKLIKAHVIQPDQPVTIHGEEWVTIEIEVKDGMVKHFINGKQTIAYGPVELDPESGCTGPLAKPWIDAQIAKAGNKLLKAGSISIQGESAPCQFRKIEIMPL